MKYLAPLLFLLACRTVQPTSNTNTMDSTMVEVRERVDTLWMDGEILEIPVYIECDSTTNKPKPMSIKKAGKNLSVNIGLDGKGLLKVKCKEDSLMEVVRQKDSIVNHLRTEKTIIQLPPVVTHTPYWFDVLFRWWALITALILAWRFRSPAIALLKKLLH